MELGFVDNLGRSERQFLVNCRVRTEHLLSSEYAEGRGEQQRRPGFSVRSRLSLRRALVRLVVYPIRCGDADGSELIFGSVVSIRLRG